MVVRRNRKRQSVSFVERLQKVAQEAREEARRLPSGPDRDMLLKKANQAETAAHIDRWLGLPGLRSQR
jgi:hypothetical protein